MMENFIGKKEKWTIKGTDKQYVADSLLLIFCLCPAQLVISNLCTKFDYPKSSSCLQIFDGRCTYALHGSERWKNLNLIKKEKQTSAT